MAETFKSFSARSLPNFSTGYQTVYTVPAGKRAIVILAQVANKESAQVGVHLQWIDISSGAQAVVMLADGVQVPAAAAVGLLTGKLVLEEGDVLQAAQEGVTPANALDLSVSLVEIDA